MAAESLAALETHMARLEISDALAAVFKLVGRANKYIDEAAPWSLAKRPEARERLQTVLYTMAETLRVTAIMLAPFLVETPGKIWRQLGLQGDPAKAWAERQLGRVPRWDEDRQGRADLPADRDGQGRGPGRKAPVSRRAGGGAGAPRAERAAGDRH